MIILPDNYKTLYPCVNSRGKTAYIFSNEEFTKAYKVYRNEFKYDKQKFNVLQTMNNPNVFTPTNTICIESDITKYIGYEMDFDKGTALPFLRDTLLTQLIESSKSILPILYEISMNHFIVTDPNVENITFDSTYNFVDTYSFTWAKTFDPDKIFNRNLIKVNETILCGLIDLNYYPIILNYLQNKHSKYLSYFSELHRSNPLFVYEILSIIQEELKVDRINELRQKIKK